MTIIGICGPSGSGKTSITKLLSRQLDQVTCIYWDDYDSLPDYEEPKDYVSWFHGNRDYAAFKTPQLATALQKLKQGEKVQHPNKREWLEPTLSRLDVLDLHLAYFKTIWPI